MTPYERRQSENQELTFLYASMVMDVREIVFDYNQMKYWGMVNESGRLTNLAQLLSDQCVHTIKFARYKGTNKENLIIKKEIVGSVLEQIAEVYNYIEEENPVIERGDDEIVLEDENIARLYPTEAIREALINAVMHRSYQQNGSIIVNVFDNRIEFLSPGGLMPGLSLEAAILGLCQLRNERLSKVFFDLGLSECLGRGLEKIKAAYKEYEVKPEIKAVAGAFFVSLPDPRNEIEKSDIVKLGKRISFIGEGPFPAEFALDEDLDILEVIERRTVLPLEKSQIKPVELDVERSGAKSYLSALNQLSEKDVLVFHEERSKMDSIRSHPDEDVNGGRSPSIEKNSFSIEAGRETESVKRMASFKKNPQHEKVMKFLNRNGSIRRSDVQEILGVGQSRALAVLNEMANFDLIEITGIGRCTEYIKKA